MWRKVWSVEFGVIVIQVKGVESKFWSVECGGCRVDCEFCVGCRVWSGKWEAGEGKV